MSKARLKVAPLQLQSVLRGADELTTMLTSYCLWSCRYLGSGKMSSHIWERGKMANSLQKYFQIHSLEQEFLNLDSNFTAIYNEQSN